MKNVIIQNKKIEDYFMKRGKLFVLSVIVGLLVLSPSNVALADHCTVSKIAIIPGPWENTANLVSLTAQVQDSSGEACHADTTIRLSFRSSGSGSFTNQGQTAVPQAWISTNQTNRNFYYNSSTLNSDSITIEAGYGSASDWSVSWTTTEGVAGLLADQAEEEDDDNSGGSGSNNPPATSAHSSSAGLSDKDAEEVLIIDAGRSRLVTTHTPVFFKAEVVENSADLKPKFSWSFGDGKADDGVEVEHVYKFAGQYEVVLNANGKEAEAVDRLEVEVIEAKLQLTLLNGLLTIKNLATEEINLGGWKIISGEENFTLAKDTIIGAGREIKLDSEILGFNIATEQNVQFLTPDDLVFWERLTGLTTTNQADLILTLTDLSNQASSLKQLLADGSEVNQNYIITSPNPSNQDVIPAEEIQASSSADELVEKVVLTPDKSRLAKILALPVLGVGFLDNLFQ